jgi:hypothetical protein
MKIKETDDVFEVSLQLNLKEYQKHEIVVND